MFRTLIYPSSGACNYSVELQHWSYCSWFDVCWEFRCGWVGVVSMLQAEAQLCASACNQCGNSTEYSQAPDDGYINVRNMLST